MANPLYQQIIGQRSSGPQHQPSRMQMAMQAMNNPAAFVKQAFPDIPDSISHNPAMILQYLQQTRGISNEQIQQIMNMGRR